MNNKSCPLFPDVGVYNSNAATRPYKGISNIGCKPSSVILDNSNSVPLATIKFNSSLLVNLPRIACVTAVGFCAVTT